MPTYERAFPTRCKPWLARITSWPNNSPPSMAFGKRVKGATTPTITIEVSESDIVRWGAKDDTGSPRPDLGGFGIWERGWMRELTKEAAETLRRFHHPEDASAAPIRGNFGRKRGPAAAAPATPPGAPPPPAPSNPILVDGTAFAQAIAHLQALVLAGEHLADAVAQHGPVMRKVQEAVVRTIDLIPGARAALLAIAPAPRPHMPGGRPIPAFDPAGPEEPDIRDRDEPEADTEEPAAIPLDKDGLPLF